MMTSPKRRFLRYQAQGFRRAKKMANLAIFWEMRLGKTLLVIRWAQTRVDNNKVLVACPLQVIQSWQDELRAEGETQIVELVGTTLQKEKAYHAAMEQWDGESRIWFLTNYEALTEKGHRTYEDRPKAVPSYLARQDWTCVIADESTEIRKPKAQITKVFLRYMVEAPHRCVMSGLPNPKGVDDYVCQLIFTHGSFMGCCDYYTWRDKYMVEDYFGGYSVRRKYVKEIEEAVAEVSLTLTRQEAGVASKKVRATRMVTIPNKILKAAEQIRETSELGDVLTKTVLENMGIEAELSGGFHPEYPHDKKLREIKYLATGELKGQPFLVWCRRTAEIEGVTAYLNKLGIRTKAVHGTVAKTASKSKEMNTQTIRAFREGKLDCMVLQAKAVSMGIDMSRASYAIIYSNWFDYELRAQLEDRGIHPTKKEPFLVIDIAARGTADQAMPKIMRKRRVTAQNFHSALMRYARESWS